MKKSTSTKKKSKYVSSPSEESSSSPIIIPGKSSGKKTSSKPKKEEEEFGKKWEEYRKKWEEYKKMFNNFTDPDPDIDFGNATLNYRFKYLQTDAKENIKSAIAYFDLNSKNLVMSDIKKKYRRLSAKLHPDKPGGNQEEFKKLSNYYESLEKFLEPPKTPKLGSTGDRPKEVRVRTPTD